MDKQCIFCSIASDKEKMIYEDKFCFAIFDVYPSNYGHMLVISKDHHANMLETPDDLVVHMFLVAKKLATKARHGFGSQGMVISTNIGAEGGQMIFHFHIHIIPKYSEKKKGFMPHRELKSEERKALMAVMK